MMSFFMIIYAMVLIYMLTLRRKKSKKIESIKNEAFELLLSRYEKKTLNNKSVRLIYKRKIIENNLDLSYEDFLEEFIMYITQKDEDGQLTIGIEAIINPILEKEREVKPYPKLEDNERQLLLAIEATANKGEMTSLKNNLDQLSNNIEDAQKALKKAQKTNRWTIPATIIGAVLTVFSFVFSLVHTPSLSEENVKNISSEISRQVDSVVKHNIDGNTIFGLEVNSQKRE